MKLLEICEAVITYKTVKTYTLCVRARYKTYTLCVIAHYNTDIIPYNLINCQRTEKNNTHLKYTFVMVG